MEDTATVERVCQIEFCCQYCGERTEIAYTNDATFDAAMASLSQLREVHKKCGTPKPLPVFDPRWPEGWKDGQSIGFEDRLSLSKTIKQCVQVATDEFNFSAQCFDGARKSIEQAERSQGGSNVSWVNTRYSLAQAISYLKQIFDQMSGFH